MLKPVQVVCASTVKLTDWGADTVKYGVHADKPTLQVPAATAVLLAVQHVQDPVLHPMALDLGLVLLAAALGGLLLTPMMRIMRSFVSALEVPEWAQQQLHFPAWLPLSLHLNLVLPPLGTVIWVSFCLTTPCPIPL